MAEYRDREHYIPLRKPELLDLLCSDAGPQGTKRLSAGDQGQFRRAARLMEAHIHFHYEAELERLKETYAPFDPDADTLTLKPLDDAKKQTQLAGLFEEFVKMMEKANFRRLSHEEIIAATDAASDWGLNLDVNFDVFERLEVFYRGDTTTVRTRRRPLNLWRLESVKVPSYRRLVIILKQKKHKRLPKDSDYNSVFVKVFKDIPKLDVEMILPGTKVKMPKWAWTQLGASFAGALGYIVYKVGTSLATLPTLLFGVATGGVSLWASPMALYGPAAAFGVFGYNQYAGFRRARMQYSSQLLQSLYYQNLDSNRGVLMHLVDEAEDQECREAWMAYFYLWRHGPDEGWTAQQLDDYVEMDLERRINTEVDFEVMDGLAKLEKLRLVEKDGDRYKAVSLDQALVALDEIWDNYFQYAGQEGTQSA